VVNAREERTVLVVTEVDDPTADLVIAELNRRDVPVVRVDPGRDFPGEARFSARLDAIGWTGELVTASRRADIGTVRSAYWRRPSPYLFPGLDEQDAAFAAAQARHGLGGVLAALPGCLYVNHPHRVSAAEYKPVQLATAAQMGFTVPPTMITSDPDAARAFIRSVGSAVYKPLRLTTYRIDGRARSIWVDSVDASEIDDRVAGTAHLFQQKVAKVADVRVTVVGDRMFCVRIDSDDGLLDWRADYSQLSYSVVTSPDGMVGALRDYLDRFGLVFGCFDFALDHQGGWHWLELNPGGQWAWMQEPTGLPMAAAFADLLEEGVTL
jgi:ATP-grasp ribosomal peptide maturase